jgi:Mg2+ and Co2+ transporter CorA
VETAKWIDLIDPPPEELRKHLPDDLHPTALELLLAPHVHDDEPRPRIDSHDTYVVGILLVAVARKDEDRIFYQEIDFVITGDRLITISKTPPGEQPFDPKPAMEACKPEEHVGMFAYRLVDEIAERYLDLIDDLNDEIDELEDHV